MDDSWKHIRPDVGQVYDSLDRFFPGHDLDKPIIETEDGGHAPSVPLTHTIEEAVEGAAVPENGAQPIRRQDDANNQTSRPATFKWLKGELIGRGNYGKVYLAMNLTTGEMIAVKQVEISSLADDRARNLWRVLELESSIMKDLDHPNIVQYLGFERTPELMSMFMEYVSGGSVGACIRKQGRLGPSVVKSFTSQILAGLEYLHSKGVIHRDLKADTVLVDPQGIIKISDFSISKLGTGNVYESDASATQMQGTIYWMAPEVAHSDGHGYSAKADIWSLGCVWQEMMSGERPWKGRDMFYVLNKLGRDREAPPLPDSLVLSEDAKAFRDACFAIDPEQRPRASELKLDPYLTLPPDWQFVGLSD